MNYRVVFTPEAEEQTAELYRYLADEASAGIAERYTDGVITYCESLRTFPNRGTMRDDIRPGLRVTSYRRRTVIAFCVETDRVMVLGYFMAVRTMKQRWAKKRGRADDDFEWFGEGIGDL